jgi:DNA-binding transcriptional MerR regulator
MEQHLTIRAMALGCKLSEHTLRYYERIGLIKSVARGSNGHRQYTPHDQAWIAFLLRLRATGMPLRDMQRFAELRYQGEQTAGARRAMLETHLDLVRKNLLELNDCQQLLVEKIAYYQGIECAMTNSINTL